MKQFISLVHAPERGGRVEIQLACDVKEDRYYRVTQANTWEMGKYIGNGIGRQRETTKQVCVFFSDDIFRCYEEIPCQKLFFT